jgi:hypothetical protein
MTAQGVPHLEQCTLTEKWDYQGGEFGVKNICDKSVVIQFMTEKYPQVKNIELKPGERFNTGLSRAQISSGWWVFTACPRGYTSSIPFQVRYENALADGKYNCIGK